MRYLLRAENEYGDPVQITVDTCWRCLALVNLSAGTMEDHADREHPPLTPPEPSRHAAG